MDKNNNNNDKNNFESQKMDEMKKYVNSYNVSSGLQQ